MRTFLSSTYADLIQYRLQAAEAVQRLGQEAGRMEVFGARPQEPAEACLQEIDHCDLFVGMYAYRYGYVPEASEVSITEMEYQHAMKRKKPVFCYLIDENYPWPPKMIEDEPGRSRLVRFKEGIQKKVVRDVFTTPEDLAMKVATSVGRYVTERSAPVYDELRNLIAQKSERQESDRRATVEALSAAVEIANRTFQYFADQRRTGKSDQERESMLAEGWRIVGVQLAGLKNPPTDLIERYFMKAQYWSSPDDWTDERIAASRIGLEEIAQESRSVLLGELAPPA